MKPVKYNGQSEQDKFVCKILKNKTDGFFIEVGSNRPIRINNTYVLESSLNWTGIGTQNGWLIELLAHQFVL